MPLRRSPVLACLPLLLLAACAGTSPSGGADERVAATDFAGWKRDFAVTAQAAGVSAATVQAVVPGLRRLPELLALDRRQPEFTRPLWDYLDNAVNDARVARGQALRARHAAALDAAQAHYGVPAEVVVAIWGIETDFGGNLGRTPVPDALATLAFAGRRSDFYRDELIAALKLIDRGDATATQLRGSWAGAMGQTQFMPSTWLAHAVDGDGDGRRDLFRSLPDAFASTAHYLADSGWRRGEPWGWEVRLPAGFDWAAVEPERAQPLARWAALGVARADGGAWPAQGEAALLAPVGRAGPVFLVTGNLTVLRQYNNALSYVLAVSHLADRIAGAGPFVTAWPRHLPPLAPAEVRELQTRLAARGFDPGTPDGLAGERTRRATRAFQQVAGLVPDGYPDAGVLARLRGE